MFGIPNIFTETKVCWTFLVHYGYFFPLFWEFCLDGNTIYLATRCWDHLLADDGDADVLCISYVTFWPVSLLWQQETRRRYHAAGQLTCHFRHTYLPSICEKQEVNAKYSPTNNNRSNNNCSGDKLISLSCIFCCHSDFLYMRLYIIL